VTVILFLGGLVCLVVGAEALVRGASSLALAVGVAPLVVGLTVVAFGTSAPEMAVSAAASRSGQTDIAIGNAVGSNIFNVLLILGACALIRPLLIAWRLVRLEVPIMIGASVLVWVLVLDGDLVRWEAALLFAGIVGYTTWTIRASRKETAAALEHAAPGGEPQATPAPWYVNVGLLLLGLVLLVVGSNWMVDGAVDFARSLGLSELVIGLTIVSAGTSLPELATSLLATYRGEREIAVGNVVGSNIFNMLAVLGIGGLVAPTPLEANEFVRGVDIPVMIAAALICLPVFFSSGTLMRRWEGVMFAAAYATYVTYLIWNASDAGAPDVFVDVARFVALPLGFAVAIAAAWRDRAHPDLVAARAG
jgi:cation:H+ antiporter